MATMTSGSPLTSHSFPSGPSVVQESGNSACSSTRLPFSQVGNLPLSKGRPNTSMIVKWRNIDDFLVREMTSSLNRVHD